MQIRKGLKLKKGSVLHCFSLLLKIKEAKQVCFTKLLSKNTYSVGKLYKPITIDGTLNMFEMSYSENFFSVPHLISWNIYIKMQHSTTLLCRLQFFAAHSKLVTAFVSPRESSSGDQEWWVFRTGLSSPYTMQCWSKFRSALRGKQMSAKHRDSNPTRKLFSQH